MIRWTLPLTKVTRCGGSAARAYATAGPASTSRCRRAGSSSGPPTGRAAWSPAGEPSRDPARLPGSAVVMAASSPGPPGRTTDGSAPTGSPAAFDPPAHLAGDLPLGIPFGQVLPLVVGPLAAGQCQLDLHVAAGEVELQRHQGQPALLRPLLQPLDLVDRRVPVHQRGAALPQGLDLGAHQRDAGLVRVHDRVVVPGLAVGRDDLPVGGRAVRRDRHAYNRTYRRSVTYAATLARITPTPATYGLMARIEPTSIGGTMPDRIGSASVLSTNRNFAAIRPTSASTAPARPASAASSTNGSCVYQREAPTSRMMPVSTRRLNAATWIVLEISSNAANACSSASAIAAFRTPLNSEKIRSSTSDWPGTWSTPFFPFGNCWARIV